MSSIEMQPGMAVVAIQGIDGDDSEPIEVWLTLDPDKPPALLNRAGVAEIGQLLIDQAHRARGSI
ncbi:MAG: hypothetical protein H0W95_03495 [Nocardioidaceae bacterium]|nr:hypothetical protein [Nocardioidaceae bacterium]